MAQLTVNCPRCGVPHTVTLPDTPDNRTPLKTASQAIREACEAYRAAQQGE